MYLSPRPITLVFCSLLLTAAQAMAAQAGWRQITIAGTPADPAPIVAALYYPTQADARTIAMGPFTVNVAMRAAPEAKVKGLILLSHGTGGSELAHSSLAEALAQQGYLVAALRHPGDNWQDRSLRGGSLERYVTERPRQASRVIDALLRDPDWKDRIASDAKGPRIGALGHSAGGYTVLALAGGRAEPARFDTHCSAARAADPIFCSTGQAIAPGTPNAAASPPLPSLTDTRVRAVVAMAPMGALFNAASLAQIRIPVAVYGAQLDRFLVPRFHAEWVAANVPGVDMHRVPNAWHFAFQDTPTMAIPSEDGDLGANPPGFDRAAFLGRLQRELPAFFDKALN
ncbi:dienelactone hydrolase [Polaromonas sp.]|uniref:alpha/beta hydrolase family protein n=1 Tax=Polaromonas sp. TaxID=1869339 RepID=UPI002730ECA3|nr:dienelactone hydrolase [Polaromonas sp.]MDP1740808.1 dienelactone hydrolase [Polaromonas sp.]